MAEARQKYIVEDLISDSESLLDEIVDIGEVLGELPDETSDAVSEDIRKKSLDSLREEIELETDGHVELTISENELKVTAAFFPPSERRIPMNPDDVAAYLKAKGVIHGIDWKQIEEACFACSTERRPVTGIVIAEATPPTDEIAEYLEIEKPQPHKLRNAEKNAARIDFKGISPFIMVSRGDVLARTIPRRPGQTGTTVCGGVIPFKKTAASRIEAGRNTLVENGRILAAIDGRFEKNESSLWVNNVLEIKGDVDYKTGHIDFPGDVIITGQIKDGFRVTSGGSIFCEQTMDVDMVSCGGDLRINKGIIGRRKGSINVHGKLDAKFIENCHVQAKGPVRIETGIINSAVHTRDRVEMGIRGVIIGGIIYGQNGVEAAQIGSASGTKTEVYCGTDYSIEEKINWIRDKNIELVFKLKNVEERLKTDQSGRDTLVELQGKLKAAIHKMNDAANRLVFHLDKNESAEVIVHGSVFPGVYIEICHLSLPIHSEMRGVKFLLDKKKGKITAVPLGPDEQRKQVALKRTVK